MKRALAVLLGLLLLPGLCAAADKTKIGLYDPATNRWFLDANGNGAWDGAPVDASYWFGFAGAIQMVGDWNGTGTSKIGMYDPATFAWYLDINANGAWDGEPTDKYGYFGVTGGTPVVGDWNGDGRTKIGMFVNNAWYLDYNGNGYWDGEPADKYKLFVLPNGQTGGIPVVGDWNGDGTTKIGMFVDPNMWFLDSNGNGLFGNEDRATSFGFPGCLPVTGDWSGTGTTKIGLYDPVTHQWYLDYNGDGGWSLTPTDVKYYYGFDGGVPITGNW